MKEAFIVVAFLVAGLINLAPLVGLLGETQLAKLYGRAFAEPDLLVLMRHRALLFGLVGSFLLAAIAMPAWRLPAGVMGLISMIGFIAIATLHQPLSPALLRIARADWFALALLVPAILLVGFKP